MSTKTQTCFVIMGYNKKTDLATGRLLNLDMSYRNLIKPVVKGLGLQCVRGDEVKKSGLIDVPMYRLILEADVVVADLSTTNPNALYELGIRHTLRPYTTIVIAEEQFAYPFDVNHIRILKYQHLGPDIGVEESRRFKSELRDALKAALSAPSCDSPLYELLPGLIPPSFDAAPPPTVREARADPSLQVIVERAREARDADPPDWRAAVEGFTEAHRVEPTDVYVHQQLVLCTYKSGDIDTAMELIKPLNPEQSNDPETLGIWGAIHKRAWEKTGNRASLDIAIGAYERGFQLRADSYNGINQAYLLNQRALDASPAEAVADYVDAHRIRTRLVSICKDELQAPGIDDDGRYWLLATLAEALLGIGDQDESDRWLEEAKKAAPKPWMLGTTLDQLAKLRALLEPSPLTQYLRSDPAA